jgi:hypothetical protein
LSPSLAGRRRNALPAPRRAGRGHVLRPHQVGGDLHQIADAHPGVREDGDDVPPAGFGLGLDASGTVPSGSTPTSPEM